MRSKEYVLMVHFAVIRFDGASGARRLTAPPLQDLPLGGASATSGFIPSQVASREFTLSKDFRGFFPARQARTNAKGKKQGNPKKKQGKGDQGTPHP